MGKRIIQQARGHGSMTYRVRKQAYRYRISYPSLEISGKAVVKELLNSPAHSAPLARIEIGKESFFVPAANGLYEGQEIEINGKIGIGNILKLKNIPQGTKIFNTEAFPGSGGKFIRSAGCSGIVMRKENGRVEVILGRRKLSLNEEFRAII